MGLNEEQRTFHDDLHRYSTALENTRIEYLDLLRNPGFQQFPEFPETQDKIWQASFILQYIMATHQKYMALLALLNTDNEPDLAIFAQLCSKLILNDPNCNLENFIDQVHRHMQTPEFTSAFTALSRTYSRRGRAQIAGGISVGVVAVALPLILIAVAAPLWAVVGIGLVAAGLLIAARVLLFIAGVSNRDKSAHMDRTLQSLAAENASPNYELTDTYTYKTEGTDVTLSKERLSQSKISLKDAFFKPQRELGGESLDQKVQLKFKDLVNASRPQH